MRIIRNRRDAEYILERTRSTLIISMLSQRGFARIRSEESIFRYIFMRMAAAYSVHRLKPAGHALRDTGHHEDLTKPRLLSRVSAMDHLTIDRQGLQYEQ